MKKLLLLTILLLGTTTLFAQNQNGLNFDSNDDYVQTSFTGVTGTTNRTFEAWIYLSPSAPNTNLAILDYGLNAVGSRNTFMVNANRGLSFISGGTNANLSSTAGIIPAGQWTQVAFVLSNGTGFFFVNGNQVGTGNLSTVNTPTTGTDLRIGRRVAGGANLTFAGVIDEVRIWNVALSQNDIITGGGSEICPSSNGLIAYYQFNEGMASAANSGVNVLPDLVSGNNGTLNNFSLSGGSSNWTPGAPVTRLIDTDISQNAGVLTAAQAGASYQWIDCGTNMAINGATAMTYTPTSIGDYAVDITNLGCTQRSDCINVSTLGLSKASLNDVSIFKNPSSYLQFEANAIQNAQLVIYNLSGKEIIKTTLNNTEVIKPDIAPGLYMVTLSQNGTSKSFKWIKE